jgi:putative drug exporter of the RND superfamily
MNHPIASRSRRHPRAQRSGRPRSAVGPIGRVGRLAARHPGRVLIAWAVVAVGLGILAPRVERALSGAGWEASGSQSVEARRQIDRNFAGAGGYALQAVVHSRDLVATEPAFRRTVVRSERVLRSDPDVGRVSSPRPGLEISRDGHTAVIRAGAAADANAMVTAADRLKPELDDTAGPSVAVDLTGASAMWSDFNEANREAMLKSEFISWPVTMAILVLAFGSLVAAGLPLMLTMVGLIASAGLLYLGTLVSPISIWAMNFALMFALALGIDYALFIVIRFRDALHEQELGPVEAVATTMDTAGKTVLLSGMTVLVSLSAVMLVPSPAFRSTALGIIVAVLFVLAATLTLLPAVLARLGPGIDRMSLPWVHTRGQRSRLVRWGELLWRRPYLFGGLATVALVALALPVLSLRTEMPSIKVVPAGDQSRQGYEQLQAGFGPGAPGALQVVVPDSDSQRAASIVRGDSGIARALPPQLGTGHEALIDAIPTDDPSSPELGTTIDRLHSELPSGALIGGPAAESHDLDAALAAKTPVVIGVVLVLGFLLLVLAFQAPLAAAIGVVTNLLSTGAAFGIAKWIFQDGHLGGLLGFESQGFLDAWAPVFFFAMIFAISMDYTVFLLSSAKENWDRHRDARGAMISGLALSGRVIFAAGAVMVAVFFTFALSGPLPPKEMGVILGVSVLLDAFVVRLLLVPMLLRIAGPAAWYVPHWLDRVLPDVRFGHGAETLARRPA